MIIERIHSILFLCKDLSLTLKFYEDIGFEVEKASDAIRIKFGDFRLAFMDEKTVMSKEAPEIKKGLGMSLYFEIDNVNSFYQDLVEKSISTIGGPKDTPWGKRELAIKDPDNYRLVFFQKINLT